jgi:hypothetical protein
VQLTSRGAFRAADFAACHNDLESETVGEQGSNIQIIGDEAHPFVIERRPRDDLGSGADVDEQ